MFTPDSLLLSKLCMPNLRKDLFKQFLILFTVNSQKSLLRNTQFSQETQECTNVAFPCNYSHWLKLLYVEKRKLSKFSSYQSVYPHKNLWIVQEKNEVVSSVHNKNYISKCFNFSIKCLLKAFSKARHYSLIGDHSNSAFAIEILLQ